MKKQETVLGYPLLRSGRKTVGIIVRPGGLVEVRAPKRTPAEAIEIFVRSKQAWIRDAVARSPERPAFPDEEEQKRLRDMAKQVIPPLVDRWASRMGVHPAGVKITCAKTRYGSCNAKGNLCFSLFLMRSPMEAVEYVVVHELVHLHYLNHSKNFWALVQHHLPDYRERKQKLV